MAYLKVGEENNTDIELYYEDHGSGKPVLLIHGWPLSGASWERQVAALLASGHRVIAYDRRGFGRSSQPTAGYDYDTLASDTYKLIEALDLKGITLVGFSMGGGEVARYLGKYAEPGRVTKAVFMSSIAPALRHSADNPEGVDPKIFEGIKQGIEADRFAFLETFFKNFYNKKVVGGTDISDEAIHASFNVGAASSYYAFLNCVDAWLEDFRADIATDQNPHPRHPRRRRPDPAHRRHRQAHRSSNPRRAAAHRRRRPARPQLDARRRGQQSPAGVHRKVTAATQEKRPGHQPGLFACSKQILSARRGKTRHHQQPDEPPAHGYNRRLPLTLLRNNGQP